MKTMISIVVLLLIIIPMESCVFVKTDKNLFLSPSGKFSVEFREINHFKFTTMNSADDVNHIIYAITFYKKSDGSKIETKYTDVYGWHINSKPTAVKSIFQSFNWSPNEDFVILPEEHWSGAPSSPYRGALNLNHNLNWSTGKVHMDIKMWADDFRVIGDIHDDGDYRVVLFNGKTGKQETVKSRGADEYQFGYHVLSANKPIVLIEKIPDNYAGDTEHFIKECETLDVYSMILKKTSCP